MSNVLQADVCPVPSELQRDLATHFIQKDERKNIYLIKQIFLNCCGHSLAWVLWVPAAGFNLLIYSGNKGGEE